MENAFAAAWRGEAEVDGFNELVLRAGLTWRQVVVLRAYAKYLRQAGTVFSQEYMESTFVAYPEIAAAAGRAVRDPVRPAAATVRRGARRRRPSELVDGDPQPARRGGQPGPGPDPALLPDADPGDPAHLFFQRGADGRPKSYVAFKLDPQAIPDLPAPRPKYEIFVYSPRFEGVHLRFGAVARGGLRWSDRREDFRTEILGLVKAQMVKNAVIVPVGAKGGFVLKQAPPGRPRGVQAEGVACYRLFIAALLDVTDNIVGGEVVPPADVVRHDGDDPYLVVAADKGTATFSDIANEISVAHGFWLGDAFASGGSAGYDHKKMGITARGAWESVKRHFRELGIDIQTQDFTVVGVGDMSGDVFGNGMLLSRAHPAGGRVRPPAHLPRPGPGRRRRPIVERRRLFDLPRSSWDDYDRSLISRGRRGLAAYRQVDPDHAAGARGARHRRRRSPRCRPAELMRAILRGAGRPAVERRHRHLRQGGRRESHADVGDKANDAIRVNGAPGAGQGGRRGRQPRPDPARPDRVRRWRHGGPGICTDFIDNSAGVDCSDHEVNIKILLGGAVADGELTVAERDALLAEMTDEVAALVLRDNYDQATALGNARAQARLAAAGAPPDDHRHGAGRPARPRAGGAADRRGAGGPRRGRRRADLAGVRGAAGVREDRRWSGRSATRRCPTRSGPPQVLRRLLPDPAARALRRPDGRPPRCAARSSPRALVNEVVNRGGIVVRLPGDGGDRRRRGRRDPRLRGGPRRLRPAARCGRPSRRWTTQVPTAAQTAGLPGDPAAARPGGAVAGHQPPLADRRHRRDRPAAPRRDRAAAAAADSCSAAASGEALRGARRPTLVERRRARGRWPSRATRVDVRLRPARHRRGGAARPAATSTEVAEVYFVLSDRFRVDELLSQISALPREDRWQTLARMALRYDLYAALAGADRARCSHVDPGGRAAEERVTQWEQANAAIIARARNAMGEFDDSAADLARAVGAAAPDPHPGPDLRAA